MKPAMVVKDVTLNVIHHVTMSANRMTESVRLVLAANYAIVYVTLPATLIAKVMSENVKLVFLVSLVM